MSDDYSMGAALDLAGKFREVADTTNQNAERAGGEVKQRVGNMAQKKASWINAEKAKTDAAKAGIEMRMAATERNFSILKKGLSIGQAIVGGVVSGVSDRLSNADRADAAVLNGAASQRRLGTGGDHQQGLSATFNFQAAKTDLDGKLGAVHTKMNEIQTKYGPGGKAAGQEWSVDDQKQYAGLRKQEQTMEQMSGELGVMNSARVNLAQPATVQIPGTENKNGNDRSFHADMQGYLKQSGMNDSQVEAFKNYDRLQSELNGVGDAEGKQAKRKSFETEGRNAGLDGSDLENHVNKEMGKLSIGAELQTRLDTVMADQHAVKVMGPAADYVRAKDALATLEKTPGADPSEISAQRGKMSEAKSKFNQSLEKDFWKGAWGQMVGQLVGEALGGVAELQEMTKRYAAAQIALSQASDQAGAATQQASDMELS